MSTPATPVCACCRNRRHIFADGNDDVYRIACPVCRKVPDTQWCELRRLRDEALSLATTYEADGAYQTGAMQRCKVAVYHECARLLGRELPEWKPGKEAK